MDWLINMVLGAVPTWAWVIVAGVALGWAWRTFGWQGITGGLLAVLTLGAYREGWKAGRGPIGQEHPVNKGDRVVGVEPAPRKKRRSLVDILRGR